MPNNATAKTKSALKRTLALLFTALCAVVAVYYIGSAVLLAQSPEEHRQPRLRIGRDEYVLEVADSPAKRAKGLGGRLGMSARQGMLFRYSNQDIRCFWMKDMRFPLDILWLDAQHQVVYAAQKVQPDSFPRTFCSDRPAQYVIELTAGQVAAHHVSIGQILNF